MAVGDDGEGLQGGAGQPGGGLGGGEPLQIGLGVRVAVETPTTGELSQHEAPALGLELLGEALELCGHLVPGDLDELRQLMGGQRLFGDEQHRLDDAPQIGGHHSVVSPARPRSP